CPGSATRFAAPPVGARAGDPAFWRTGLRGEGIAGPHRGAATPDGRSGEGTRTAPAFRPGAGRGGRASRCPSTRSGNGPSRRGRGTHRAGRGGGRQEAEEASRSPPFARGGRKGATGRRRGNRGDRTAGGGSARGRTLRRARP